MTNSIPMATSPKINWRRILVFGLAGCAIYLVSVGPVTRFAPEFADWFYAPLSPLADIPLAGAALRGWLSLWGVDVS